MAERGHIEEVLDEVGRAGLSQPEEHGEAVFQQEDAGLAEPLLRAAHWSRDRLAGHIHSVLIEITNA